MHHEFINSGEGKRRVTLSGRQNIPAERRKSFFTRILKGGGEARENLHN